MKGVKHDSVANMVRVRSWTRVMDEAFRDALQAFASPRDVLRNLTHLR